MNSSLRFLIFGAHPDDCDICFGGTALRLARSGGVVKFVSLCNGDCGHFAMRGEELARRRFLETQESAKILGLKEYQVLHHIHDCELEPTLDNRRLVTRIIREFRPDVVLGHRLCDYHADHRAAAQLVQDAAYLTQVPMFCPETPISPVNPVFGCLYDSFTDPRPFRPDAAVPIDELLEEKCRALDCQVSQFYEWLPWDKGLRGFDHTRMTWPEKRDYLMRNWGNLFAEAAELARKTLVETCGESGKGVRYAEVFELSPYGRKVSVEEFRAFFI